MSHTHEAVQKAGPGTGLCWTVRRLQPNLWGAPEQAGLLPGARGEAQRPGPGTLRSTLHRIAPGKSV